MHQNHDKAKVSEDNPEKRKAWETPELVDLQNDMEDVRASAGPTDDGFGGSSS